MDRCGVAIGLTKSKCNEGMGHCVFFSSSLSRCTSFSLKKGLRPRLLHCQSGTSVIIFAPGFDHVPSGPGQNPIRPRLLISSLAIDEIAGRIHFQASENILRKRYPSVIRGIPMVIDVNIPPAAPSTGATLSTRPTSAIASRAAPAGPYSTVLPLLGKECTAGAKTRSATGSHGLGLRNHARILKGMIGQHGMKNGDEGAVFVERIWSRGDGGGCSDGQ